MTASEMEGVGPTADWSHWIQRGKATDSSDGSGFTSTWKEDLAQLAGLGISELMITMEWARLWPTQAEPSHKEIEFRRDLLLEVAALGMTPWVCLVDGSLPGWFADDERGFNDERSRRLLWPRHVDWIGETFGDLVGGWVPLREPTQWAIWGNLLGVTPPGRQRPRDALKATMAMLEADLIAWNLLKGSAPVATYHTARAVYPEADNVKARPHSEWLDETLTDLWMHQISEGDGRQAFDRVILQLRPAIEVDGQGAWSVGARGNAPEPQLEAFARLADIVGDRSLVAAGDLAGVPDDGQHQPDHIDALALGVRSLGATGWWQTSPIDGWHWLGGFGATPGVVDRDRNEREAAGTLRSLGAAGAKGSGEASDEEPTGQSRPR